MTPPRRPPIDVEHALATAYETVLRADNAWTLETMIGALEGRYGRDVYTSTWAGVAGRAPNYDDEQAVVRALLRKQLYPEGV